jgi:1,2-phenylacetyl-CoA epoxidase catalytic subunit
VTERDPVAAALRAAIPPAMHQTVGLAWADAGLSEHASVASFARTVQELLALGAPADLVEEALEAAQDEVRHARTAFALAGHLLDHPVGPGPLEALAPRALDLAELARTTFEEACVDETLGAHAAERALAHCHIGPLREALQAILDEESRHAILAWKTVGWALGVGGAPVRAVLQELLAGLAEDAADVDEAPDPSTRAMLEAGILPEPWLAAHRAWVEVHLVRPTLVRLLAEPSGAS